MKFSDVDDKLRDPLKDFHLDLLRAKIQENHSLGSDLAKAMLTANGSISLILLTTASAFANSKPDLLQNFQPSLLWFYAGVILAIVSFLTILSISQKSVTSLEEQTRELFKDELELEKFDYNSSNQAVVLFGGIAAWFSAGCLLYGAYSAIQVLSGG